MLKNPTKCDVGRIDALYSTSPERGTHAGNTGKVQFLQSDEGNSQSRPRLSCKRCHKPAVNTGRYVVIDQCLGCTPFSKNNYSRNLISTLYWTGWCSDEWCLTRMSRSIIHFLSVQRWIAHWWFFDSACRFVVRLRSFVISPDHPTQGVKIERKLIIIISPTKNGKIMWGSKSLCCLLK